MRILMLTPYLPYPPSSGGQVRSYNLLKNLGRKYKVVLVALIKDPTEEQYVRKLKKFCEKIYVCKRSESPWTLKNIFQSIFGKYPFLVVRNYSRQAENIVADLLKKEVFDLIHAETFYIMPHIPSTQIPIFLVEQTIEYRVYQHFVKNLKPLIFRLPFYFDIWKLKYWEKTYWRKADLVGAVSIADQEHMLELLDDLKIEIVPNAAGEDLLDLYEKKIQRIIPVFLYQGNFAWLQNIEAAQILTNIIMPKLKDMIKDAFCIIAGQRASEKIGYLKKKDVQVLDIQPDDTYAVRNVYKKASIFLAPIQGPGGTRLKILGAMAAGLPVVSTNAGIQGLDVKDNYNVLIAKDYDDFAAKTFSLLKDYKLYTKIRTNARKLVEQKYNWKKVAKKLENIYSKLKK